MKSFIFIGGLIIGSIFGMMSMTHYAKEAKNTRYINCGDNEVAVCIPYGVQVSNSATLKLSKDGGDFIEKVIARKEIQLRIYADDGTYMLAADHEFIGTDIEDSIASTTWIRDKK